MLGPQLSERTWGALREDYSPGGDAWDFLPQDYARSKPYRWNEDGIAGLSDRHQYTRSAVVFRNERDPIIKERLFGSCRLSDLQPPGCLRSPGE